VSSLAIKLLLGAGLGALLGYYGQCSSGTCPLTANWKRGALYGAALGLLFHFAAGGGSYKHPKNVKAIAAADYEAEVTRAGQPVVVDFFAPWCGPCKTLAPRLDKLAGEFGDRIKFVSINLDLAQDLARELNVQGVPTLFFFSADGTLADTSVGLLTADALRAKLEARLTKRP
jgi:thioredoxin 1